MLNYQSTIDFFKEVYRRFNDDEITALSAQLSYYLILAFFPFLIFLITLITYTPLVTEESLYALANLMPQETSEIVMEVVFEVVNSRSLTVLSFGMIGTLWASSNGVAAIIRGINKAYDQKDTRSFFIIRGLALLFTFALVMAILTTLVLLVLGQIWLLNILDFLGISPFFIGAWQLVRYGIAITIMWVIFTALYRFAPNRKITYSTIIPGSTFATIGWLSTSLIFTYIINQFGNFSYMYGSIGGIFVLLMWLYISSIIILLGAEINATLLFNRAKKR